MRHPKTEFLITTKKSSTSDLEIQQIFAEYINKYPNHQIFFTDGSRTDTATGAGAWGPDYTFAMRLSPYHSIYTAELLAIHSALDFIIDKEIPNSIICTDSQSAVTALSALHNSSHPIIYEIRRLFNSALHKPSVTIIWIPGHSGIQGNTRADELARHSLTIPPPPDAEFCIPVDDLLSLAFHLFKTRLQSDWAFIGHHPLKFIKPTLEHWSSSYQNTRRKETLLSRLRIGHTKLTHDFLFNDLPPPSCNQCNVRITVQHFLLDCPIFRLERRHLTAYINQKRLPLNLRTLLGDADPEVTELLFDFLHTSRLETDI